VLGSIGCALSGSLTQFVIARIIQGAGGAMMTPVGRLILVRSIDKRLLVNAMALVTIPALIGPICGPPLGGFITTYASWHWIFIINVPIGLVGVAMATRYIPDVQAERPPPFDFVGFVLSGLGIGGLAFGLSVMGLALLPAGVVATLISVGAVSAAAYVLHARRKAAPILDLRLFKFATFRASIFGGFMFRLGIGALPFLLPLLLQIGFGLTPFQSGLITFTGAVGSIFMKAAVAGVLKRFGYRPVLVYNSLISAAFLAACASSSPACRLPRWLPSCLPAASSARCNSPPSTRLPTPKLSRR
jgi:MFS family permease